MRCEGTSRGRPGGLAVALPNALVWFVVAQGWPK